MIRKLIAAAAILASALSATAAQAEDAWVLMGSKNVTLANDSDTIDVSSARGSYEAVRIVAKRRGIELTNIEVVYNSGPAHDERRPINLLPNERTRPINESKEHRFIDRINLSFKPQPSAEVATVIEVYGMQGEQGARATRSGAAVAVASAATGPVTGIIAGKPTSDTPTTVKPGKPVDTSEVLFGAQAVGFAVDRDVIHVGAEIGKFDRVRLRVLENDIHISSMKVIYTNGEAQEIAYDADIRKDTRTQWFDLKGDRFIKDIQFVYRAKPNFRGQAYLEVYGQYADGWNSAEAAKYNHGYELIGAQTAGFSIDRNDVLRVGRSEGGFKRIEVRVRDQAITLYEVKVVYADGEVDTIPANRTNIEAGGRFGPIDLKGGTHVIQEIRPAYRTQVIQHYGNKISVIHGRAIVEFWGQH